MGAVMRVGDTKSLGTEGMGRCGLGTPGLWGWGRGWHTAGWGHWDFRDGDTGTPGMRHCWVGTRGPWGRGHRDCGAGDTKVTRVAHCWVGTQGTLHHGRWDTVPAVSGMSPRVTPGGGGPQDVDIRELPRAGDSAAAFTFFRSYRDGLWRFESAAHPGWFLCTSPRGHQPLALCCHRDVTSHLIDFYFQLC